MGKKTINQLTAITSADGSDELAIYDVSENKTKKITLQNAAKSGATGSVADGNQQPVSGGAVYTAISNEASARNTAIENAINALIARQGLIYRIPRWLRFSASSKTSLVIKAGTMILVGTHIYEATEDMTYSMGTLTAGKDYFVYLNFSNNSWTVTCSQTKSADTSTSRYIGRFHTLCVSVPSGTTMIAPSEVSTGNYLIKQYDQNEDADFYAFYNKIITSSVNESQYYAVTMTHPLAGYSAGDILPESIFCLSFKPASSVEDAMVYDRDTEMCIDVYLQSGKGKTTRSAYNATHTVLRTAWDHQADFLAVGKRMLKDFEFTSASLGSNQATNIKDSNNKTKVGGNVDTSDRRMISAIGCEEMCGYLWQWLEEYVGNSSSGWIVQDGSTNAPFGKGFYNVYQLLAGGLWDGGSSCGSRCRASNHSRALVDRRVGGRGSSRAVRGIR